MGTEIKIDIYAIEVNTTIFSKIANSHWNKYSCAHYNITVSHTVKQMFAKKIWQGQMLIKSSVSISVTIHVTPLCTRQSRISKSYDQGKKKCMMVGSSVRILE